MHSLSFGCAIIYHSDPGGAHRIVAGRDDSFCGHAVKPSRRTAKDAHEDHDRVLHRLKLRAPGHQFGGRNQVEVPGRRGAAGPVERRALRGDARWEADLREVEDGSTRGIRRGVKQDRTGEVSGEAWTPYRPPRPAAPSVSSCPGEVELPC